MPVWLTFFISALLVGGFFASLFGLVLLLVEGRRTRSAPRLGLASGEGPDSFGVWVHWDPSQFALEVYRLRFQYLSPFSLEKEGTFTVTFEAPQTVPFIQCVELPSRFKTLLSNGRDKGILTVDFRTVNETCIQNTYSFEKVRRVLGGSIGKLPKTLKNAIKLAKVKEDPATVLTLDFEELTVNRKRIAGLEAAAKAKAAKMAAKPTVAPAQAAAAASAPTPPASTVAPAAKDQPVKSVREVVSQQNSKPVEK